LHEPVQWSGESGPDLLRQMRVKLRGPHAPVAEVLLDDPQVDPGLKQMGCVCIVQISWSQPQILRSPVELSFR